MFQVFLKFWDCLNIPFTIEGITFTLWNVIEASIILGILGFAIGKLVFFINGKR